jgi:hypothetical protein
MIKNNGLVDGHKNCVIELARELADIFYDQASSNMGEERSLAFRQAYPTFKDYRRGLQHCKNGDIKIDRPGWRYFEKMALQQLSMMLGMPKYNTEFKDKIYNDICDYKEASKKSNLKSTQWTPITPLH